MKIGFLDPQNPEHWVLNIRRFLSRFPLRCWGALRGLFGHALIRWKNHRNMGFSTETLENNYFSILSDKLCDNPVKF